MVTTEAFTEIYPESELIISDEHRIYHLDLHPDELADTVITVGDPNRVPLVSRHFDSIELTHGKRELITHTGYVGSKRISVVSTGMGTGNIDIVLHELDALKNIDFQTRHRKESVSCLTIIRIGTSGSLQADIPIDSTVLSGSALGFDNLLHYYPYHGNEYELALEQAAKAYFADLNPYAIQSDETLLQHFSSLDNTVGITATCPGFYGPQGRKLRAGLQFPDFIKQLQDFKFQGKRITNFEMETSAIYGLAKLLGHRALSVNAIVANRATQVFTKQGEKIMDNLIKTTLSQIAALS